MLEVEPTDQRSHAAIGNGRDGRSISFRRSRGDTLLCLFVVPRGRLSRLIVSF